LCAAPIGFAVARRQLQQAVVLHAQHGDTATHILEPSIVAPPIEPFAHEPGQRSARGVGMVCDQLAASSSRRVNVRPQ